MKYMGMILVLLVSGCSQCRHLTGYSYQYCREDEIRRNRDALMIFGAGMQQYNQQQQQIQYQQRQQESTTRCTTDYFGNTTCRTTAY